MGMMEDEVDTLALALSDTAPAVRAAAVQALGGLGDTGLNYASVIGNLLFDADPAVRVAALGALGTMGEFGMAFADEVTDCLDDVEKALPEPAVFATVKTVPAEAEVGWSQMGDMFSFSRDQLQELLKQGEH